MSVFGQYARSYDLLNRDKDYEAETKHADALLRGQGDRPRTLLDIGCGTGRYALEFAKLGYTVLGIDLSNEMVERANLLRDSQSADVAARMAFMQGDAARFDAGRRFDAAVALFHVVNYQATEPVLRDTFDNVSQHLSAGGLFLFDSWHGPAVLHLKPENRTRQVEDEHFRVVRHATPTLIETQQVVDVRFDFEVTDQSRGHVARFTEMHKMRYLFQEEVSGLLEASGLELLRAQEWITGDRPGKTSWSVSYLARKR